LQFELKDEIKRTAWKESGILVVDVNHGSLSPSQRAFLENIGTMFYGRRKQTRQERGRK
jgi:hypothetical protein